MPRHIRRIIRPATSTRRALCRLAAPIAFAGLVGCASGVEQSAELGAAGPNPGVGEGVMALSADINGDTDIAGAAYRVVPVSCQTGVVTGGPVEEAVTDLSDVRLPGMIGPFEDAPLDRSSSHVIADQYFVLPAGCYDVEATPLDADGNASGDCSVATGRRVVVEDGETTEIMLISQCRGPAIGGLDVILAFNHPPELVDLTYDPDKFLFECEYATLCATFVDPDDDPLEIRWSPLGGREWAAGPELVSRTRDPLSGEVTECVRVASSGTGRYDFRVDAFDLLHLDGELRPFEEWHARNGAPMQSRDGLRSMFYVNWDIEALCHDPVSCELQPLPGAREIDRAPGCDWVTPEAFYCSEDYVDDPEIFCPGGEFDPTTVYPACE